MQGFENLQNFLDNVATCPEGKLPDFIYGYSNCSPAAQKVLISMMSFLRAPSADLRMTLCEVRQSGRFTMVVAYLPWPEGDVNTGLRRVKGSGSSGLRPIIICGESGHEQIVGYVLPFDQILLGFGYDNMQEVMELTKWWIESCEKRRKSVQ